MAVGLLAEKLVGARSRYALYVTESYRTLSTTVPLCATNPGVQVSCDVGVSVQRGRLDAAVLRVEEEVCGKSGPVGAIIVRTRLACCQLWSGCIDVVRPQLSKRRHEGGLLELQLHGLRRAGGRARRNPRHADFRMEPIRA